MSYHCNNFKMISFLLYLSIFFYTISDSSLSTTYATKTTSVLKNINILLILADDLGYGDTSVAPFKLISSGKNNNKVDYIYIYI